MKKRLCPECGHFALELVLSSKPGEKDRLFCGHCHKEFPYEEPTVSLDRDSVQRFPNPNDFDGETELSKAMRRKKP